MLGTAGIAVKNYAEKFSVGFSLVGIGVEIVNYSLFPVSTCLFTKVFARFYVWFCSKNLTWVVLDALSRDGARLAGL